MNVAINSTLNSCVGFTVILICFPFVWRRFNRKLKENSESSNQIFLDSDRGGAQQRAEGDQASQPGGTQDRGLLTEGHHQPVREGGGVEGEGEEQRQEHRQAPASAGRIRGPAGPGLASSPIPGNDSLHFLSG